MPSSSRPDDESGIVHGYDAAFWHESYSLLRDAITAHLDDCIRDDDVAEEAILVEAIETAGTRLVLVAQFVERCAEIRNGSPNAFYAHVDAFCQRIAVLAHGDAVGSADARFQA